MFQTTNQIWYVPPVSVPEMAIEQGVQSMKNPPASQAPELPRPGDVAWDLGIEGI